MVAWTKQQVSGLQSEIFVMLLHKLGFHLPADMNKLFPRIPHYWSAEHIHQLVQKLGPVEQDTKLDLLPILESTKLNNLPSTFKRPLCVSTPRGMKRQGLVLDC